MWLLLNQVFDIFMSLFWHKTEKSMTKKRYQEVLGKSYFFSTPTFLFYRFREGVQEGYVRKKGMVNAPGILFIFLFFRNSLYHPWPPYQQSAARWGNSRGNFLLLYFYKFNFKIIYLNVLSKFSQNSKTFKLKKVEKIFKKFWVNFTLSF